MIRKAPRPTYVDKEEMFEKANRGDGMKSGKKGRKKPVEGAIPCKQVMQKTQVRTFIDFFNTTIKESIPNKLVDKQTLYDALDSYIDK